MIGMKINCAGVINNATGPAAQKNNCEVNMFEM